MTSEHPHMFVSVKGGGAVDEGRRDSDRWTGLLHRCAHHLPSSVETKIISSESSLDWSVFRHSTAPYSPAFDPFQSRTLVRLSLAAEPGTSARPLQTAAVLAGHALTLAGHLPIDVICWPYAQLVSDIGQLRAAMERLARGEDAPVLQFVRMTVRADATLTSTGLYYFCGQEIRLSAIGQMSPAGLVRRACRIAADAMLNGPYERAEAFAGLAAGEQVEIRPEPKGHWRRKPQWLSVQCDVRSAILSGMDA